jgi:hypothetical protein
MFGGAVAVYQGPTRRPHPVNDFWTLNFSGTPQWTRIVPATAVPAGRMESAAVYDRIRDRMVIFGGHPYSNVSFTDTWAFLFRDGIAAVNLTPEVGTVPGEFYMDQSGTMIFDPQYDGIFRYGGLRDPWSPGNELHRLRFGTMADIAIVGSGDVTRSPENRCLAGGESLTLTAIPTPGTGQSFDHWSGDVTGTQNPIQVVMDRSKSIVAHFRAPGTYILAANPDPSEAGTVTRTPEADSYAPGTHVTLTATAVGRFVFAGWSGDATGEANTLEVVVDRDMQVTATFSASTATQASLISTEAESDHVRLVWYAADVGEVAVDRAEGAAPWRTIARLQPDGARRLVLVDNDVLAGKTYRYRLVTVVGGRSVALGETAVSVPTPARLAIASLRWDRDLRGGTVTLALPYRGAATLELFDVLGRKQIRHDFEASTAGKNEVRWRTDRAIAAGMYFVRVTQRQQTTTKRFVLLP